MFMLGHKLMKLAELALPRGPLRPGDRLILVDLGTHPGSSISEITERTGYPQSHVSTTVAKFRDLGVVETEIDPADRRRTLVKVVPSVIRRSVTTVKAPVDGVLARAMETDDDRDLREVLDALDLLARRLTPKVAVRADAGRSAG